MKIYKYILLIAFFSTLAACSFQAPEYLQMISSTELNKVMEKEDVFLMDVHTPRQPHIKGTDLFVPYNEVEAYKDRLPLDKNMPIYIYCAGGPMGNAAARALHDLGYNNLINLEGGANAWRSSGFKFE